MEPLRKEYFWCDYSQGIPPQAIHAGFDKDGGKLYVGRARHERDIVPAKIVPNHRCAYISYGGMEHRKDEYEVLCKRQGNVIWRESSNGSVPPGAIAVGKTSSGENLYVGRAYVDGTLTPGKIHPSHRCCYIPYNGKETPVSQYEVLIIQ